MFVRRKYRLFHQLKFEQLNIAYIRDEIDPYIDFLDKKYKKNKMKECEEYLLRLKKLS